MYPKSLTELIERLKFLPGVGEKTAERYAFSIMEMNLQEAKEFAQAINDVHEKITHCRICGNLSEKEVISKISRIMRRYPGKVQVLVFLRNGKIMSSQQSLVRPSLEFAEEMAELLGHANVKIKNIANS